MTVYKENYNYLWGSRTKINTTPVIRSSITCNSESNILASRNNTTCLRNISNFVSPELIFRELKTYLAVQMSQKKLHVAITDRGVKSTNDTWITAETTQTYDI